MKIFLRSLGAALILVATPVHADSPCFKVDDENTPAVTLSGRVTLHHHRLAKDSELRPADGFYLTLDSPLRLDNGAGCQTWDEISIFEVPEKWNNRHVILEGELGRFVSALVYPSIFIKLSTPPIRK